MKCFVLLSLAALASCDANGAAPPAYAAAGPQDSSATAASRQRPSDLVSVAARWALTRGGAFEAPRARIQKLLRRRTGVVEKVSQGGGAVAVADKGLPIAGAASVVGGVLVHLCLGTIYCFGNFMSYMPKDMLYFKGAAAEGNPHALLVLPVTMLFQCMGLPIGALLQKHLPPRVVALIGSWVMVTGVYLSSYATDLNTFMVFYSMIFGLGIGSAYTAAWVEGWKWFPRRRGLVSGAVLTGFGAGGFFFNRIGTKLANPNNLNAIDGTFPMEVYSNWGYMLRSLAVIYGTMTAIGAFLIRPPPKSYVTLNSQGLKSAGTRSLTVPQAIRTKQFWLIWACIFTSVCGGLNVSANYKYLGAAAENLNDDAYLSLVGGLGALANGAGRLFWGTMADSYGFKAPVLSMTAMQAVLFPLYKISTNSRPTFLVATMLAYFCLGGNFSIFAGLMPKTFGPENGAAIYSVMYTAFGSTAIASFFAAKKLIADFGWQGVFNGLGALSVLSFLIGSAFTPLKL